MAATIATHSKAIRVITVAKAMVKSELPASQYSSRADSGSINRIMACIWFEIKICMDITECVAL